MQYDVFNGDADGICALQQLRLADPVPDATRVTGVKRDIKLLTKITQAENAQITVLDISLDSNREALETLLSRHNTVFYVDHHFHGDIPESSNLSTLIEPSAEICTSLLVNQHLGGRYAKWAICGAFGDNLHKQAEEIADQLHLNPTETETLRQLGELFNYNGYGSSVADLHFSPDDLYQKIQGFEDPLAFCRQDDTLEQLQKGYDSDMEHALAQKPLFKERKNRVYSLPDEPWARRISGVFANLKAREQQESAHALITRNSDNSWRVSVRAPMVNRQDADTLCKQFPTGGGRAAAAGINSLPEEMFDTFLEAFDKQYP